MNITANGENCVILIENIDIELAKKKSMATSSESITIKNNLIDSRDCTKPEKKVKKS